MIINFKKKKNSILASYETRAHCIEKCCEHALLLYWKTVKERPYRRNTVVDTDSAESSPIGGGSGGGSGCREPAAASCVAMVGTPKRFRCYFTAIVSTIPSATSRGPTIAVAVSLCRDLFFFFLIFLPFNL